MSVRQPSSARAAAALASRTSARVAGNIVNDDIVGSAEFATKLAGAKLIVVLGHSECGAIKGAIDGAELGKLTGLLQKIRPAVEASSDAAGDHTSKNKDFVQQVAITNAKLAAESATEVASFVDAQTFFGLLQETPLHGRMLVTAAVRSQCRRAVAAGAGPH